MPRLLASRVQLKKGVHRMRQRKCENEHYKLISKVLI